MGTAHTTKKRAGKRVTKGKRSTWLYIIIGALAVAAVLAYILIASFAGLPGGILSDVLTPPEYLSEAGNISVFDPEYLHSHGSFKSYNDPETGISSKLGVDVSVWQGAIDWELLKEQGIEFVIIRLGYSGYETGAIQLDENFDTNISGAIDAGIDVGVYFYSQAINEKEAAAEAKFVLEHIKGYDVLFPIVYDPEDYTADAARTDGLTGEQVTQNCISFCSVIEDAGLSPMVYTNNYWATSFLDMDALSVYPIWYADYNDVPILTEGFSMWQYSNEESLAGTDSTYIDMDLYFYIDEE